SEVSFLLMRVVFALLAVVALVAARSLSSESDALKPGFEQCAVLVVKGYVNRDLNEDDRAILKKCFTKLEAKTGKNLGPLAMRLAKDKSAIGEAFKAAINAFGKAIEKTKAEEDLKELVALIDNRNNKGSADYERPSNNFFSAAASTSCICSG
ncbi:hypothetical protein PFISCL1PPCAC_28815, partial [Pristionchus fissidentatus]